MWISEMGFSNHHEVQLALLYGYIRHLWVVHAPSGCDG